MEFFLDRIISGQSLTGLYHTSHEKMGANPVQSTDYPILYQMKKEINFSSTDQVWDIGCGMGRFIGFLSLCGYKGKITGVEIDQTYAQFCSYIFRKKKNITILNNNAINTKIPEDSVVYLYNPFKAPLLEKFLSQTQCRKIVYCYDVEKEVFNKFPEYILEKSFYSHLNDGTKVHISVYKNKNSY